MACCIHSLVSGVLEPFWHEQLPAVLASPVTEWPRSLLALSSGESNPLIAAMLLCALCAAYSFLSSTITGNCSTVDRLWSIAPVVYAWIFAARSGGGEDEGQYGLKGADEESPLFASHLDPRCLLMALLVTLWGCRLTFNFWRRGGYAWEGEDYRWLELRKVIPKLLWPVFNLLFISIFQHVLLMAITLPLAFAYAQRGTALNRFDAAAATTMFLAIIGEAVADQQQWSFQSEKYRLKAAGKPLTVSDGDYAKGFCTSGLFALCRHPNFFFEQTVWVAFALFSNASIADTWQEVADLNWSFVGVVVLMLLFQGSTTMTEGITRRKYPEYEQYQKSTSRLVPWFPAKTADEDTKND